MTKITILFDKPNIAKQFCCGQWSDTSWSSFVKLIYYLKFVHPTRTDSNSRLTFSSQILYLFVHVMWLSQKKNYNMRVAIFFFSVPSTSFADDKSFVYQFYTLKLTICIFASFSHDCRQFAAFLWTVMITSHKSVTRKMKNLEAADLLEDSISDSFCRKTKEIISKSCILGSLPKTLYFLWLKGERIRVTEIAEN